MSFVDDWVPFFWRKSCITQEHIPGFGALSIALIVCTQLFRATQLDFLLFFNHWSLVRFPFSFRILHPFFFPFVVLTPPPYINRYIYLYECVSSDLSLFFTPLASRRASIIFFFCSRLAQVKEIQGAQKMDPTRTERAYCYGMIWWHLKRLGKRQIIS